MEDRRKVEKLRLWDYGWAHKDDISIMPPASPSALIDAYLQSPEFKTTFLDEKIAENIHGPFQRSSLVASDFLQVSPQDFLDRLESARLAPGFTRPPDKDQWRDVLIVARQMVLNPWLFVLARTEKDANLFHDWGFVLGAIFREFLAGAQGSDKIERLVISLD